MFSSILIVMDNFDQNRYCMFYVYIKNMKRIIISV